jgi:predicted NBD/HSP70 family sugar kinase
VIQADQAVTPRANGARPTVRAFQTVCRNGPMSRAKLKATLGVSLSTITAAVQEVIERRVLVEAGHAVSTGGRPPVLLDIAPDLGGVLAVDLGGANLRVAAADVRGTIRHRTTVPTSVALANGSLESVVLEALESARSLLAGPVRAVTASVAGIVDPRTGTITRADNIPGWRQGDDLGWLRRFGAPLIVDNEANLGALGEYRSGVGQGSRDMLFVAVGAGIGAGLVLDGALYRGSSGAAGEIGLLRRGYARANDVLEPHAADGAVTSGYAERTARTATAAEIFALASQGDAAAAAVVETIVDELAFGIAHTVVVLNPGLVVLGGGFARAGEALLAPLRARLEPLVPVVPELVLGRLGPDAALIGALDRAAEAAQDAIAGELGEVAFHA